MRKKVITLGAIPVFLVLIGAPFHNALALSASERYNVGWQTGASEGQADWNNGNPYNDSCPSGHSDAFCSGYQAGYANYWNTAQQNMNGNVQQSNEQNANVNIKGNNNKVSIEQQAGNNDGEISDGHHHSGNGQNPECVVICLGVNVR